MYSKWENLKSSFSSFFATFQGYSEVKVQSKTMPILSVGMSRKVCNAKVFFSTPQSQNPRYFHLLDIFQPLYYEL